MTRQALHLAIPVDDLDRAQAFYGDLLGLRRGRSTEHWIDWDMGGNQLVTHLVDAPSTAAGVGTVDSHEVPVPHFGLLVGTDFFHELAQRLHAADVRFLIEPYLRYAGEPGEQWTMFFHDPAGNAIEFKAFKDEEMVFAS